MTKKRLNLAPCALLVLLLPTHGHADRAQTDAVRLSYSDGKAAITGLSNVNAVLRSIGVRVSTVPLPEEARPLLKVSQTRALKPEEADRMLSIFSLDREQLLDEISKAGRQPAVQRGGLLSTFEVGVPPYPKVYDLSAMSAEDLANVQARFGKLHVNRADDGLGIDELMTVVSGGPFTWFFLLPDGAIGKLTVGRVELDGLGWRISYPGLVPHGGFLDEKHGLIVAHAHGPKSFVMRYEDPSVSGAKMLGTNSWIDFSGKTPRLRD